MKMPATLPTGKLSANLLARLLSIFSAGDPRLVLGPGIGQDVAVLDMGERYLAAKTDPITFATDEIGWYAVNVNANDVATVGATPRWFLFTLLLPEGSASEGMARAIFGQVQRACDDLGVTVVGGHTEVTYDLHRPILVGQMLGEVEKRRLITPTGARPGDHLVLLKGIAIEATALLARERAAWLTARGYDADFISRCQSFLHEPGISVVRAASLLVANARVHAMHDPTEGGLATALHELATAADVGLLVERQRIPVLPECRRLCADLGLDPLGAIASGALLAAVDPVSPTDWPAVLAAAGIPCAIIGQVTPREEGVLLRDGDAVSELPIFPQDEITRIFQTAPDKIP